MALPSPPPAFMRPLPSPPPAIPEDLQSLLPDEIQHLVGLSSTPYSPSPPLPLPPPPIFSPPPFPPWMGDPFSEWLLSLVGWQYPLRIDQQALIISLLGLAVVLGLAVLLLLLTVGVSAACEDVLALLRGECCLCWVRFRGTGKGTFVLLDEGTDVQAAAIAAAELSDGRLRPTSGSPRGIAPEDEESGQSAGEGTDRYNSLTIVPPAAADGPTTPLNAPRGGRSDLGPAQRLTLPSTANSGAATSRGMCSDRFGSPSPMLSQRAASARPGTARLSLDEAHLGARDAMLGASSFRSESGWKDKCNPNWYGV